MLMVIVLGIFNFIIIDEVIGCMVIDMVIVVYDIIFFVVVVVVDGLISCDSEIVLLDGFVFGQGLNVIYNWRSLFLGDVSDNIIELVGVLGFYVLIVCDIFLGCVVIDIVFVVQDMMFLLVILILVQNLNCNRDMVIFVVSVDLDLGIFIIDWGNSIFIIEGDIIVWVIEFGVYIIIVINDIIGCEIVFI